MKKNTVAVAALAAALSLGTISVASADTTTPPAAPSVGAHGPAAQLTTVLAALVAKGTITQAQSDAIVAALKAATPTPPTGAPAIGGMGKGPMGQGMGKGPMGGFGMNTAAREAIITSTLGITAADLKTARQAGKSLASLAGTKTAALITALVNYDSTQIDAAVTAKTLTADQATTLKAGLTAHVTSEVNNAGPAMGKGRGGHDGPGMGQAPQIPGASSGAPSVNGSNTSSKSTTKKSTTKTKTSA